MNDTPDIPDPSSNRAEGPAESAGGSPAKPAGGTVFISHNSRNAEAAMQMVAALEAAGVLCWVAPRDIAAGSDSNDSIMPASTITGRWCWFIRPMKWAGRFS